MNNKTSHSPDPPRESTHPSFIQSNIPSTHHTHLYTQLRHHESRIQAIIQKRRVTTTSTERVTEKEGAEKKANLNLNLSHNLCKDKNQSTHRPFEHSHVNPKSPHTYLKRNSKPKKKQEESLRKSIEIEIHCQLHFKPRFRSSGFQIRYPLWYIIVVRCYKNLEPGAVFDTSAVHSQIKRTAP
jgi:hypothetical protein